MTGPALAGEEERLLACVHCGFCLTACPTYRVLGDENDSPRGRLHLMRALAEGRLEDAEAFTVHTDRCLGCRACETACPAGVEYGALLEVAREDRRELSGGPGAAEALILRVFGSRRLTRLFLGAGRWLRELGLAGLLGGLLPGRAGLALRLLAATRPPRTGGTASDFAGPGEEPDPAGEEDAAAAPAVHQETGTREYVLLEGCVMSGLFDHVHRATRRALRATGHREVTAAGQGCCGALHAHAGDRESARRLARRNLEAFRAHPQATLVANSAGCGAALRDYPDWFRGDPVEVAGARELAERARDVTELLADPPRPRYARLEGRAAYDAPCHLSHGQGVRRAPLGMLERVEGLEVTPLPSSERCCGGAGTYNLSQPQISAEVLEPKLREIREGGYDWLLTGNPGCIMQIGAGLGDRSGRGMVPVLHPVELLDRAFRASGVYGPEGSSGRPASGPARASQTQDPDRG